MHQTKIPQFANENFGSFQHYLPVCTNYKFNFSGARKWAAIKLYVNRHQVETNENMEMFIRSFSAQQTNSIMVNKWNIPRLTPVNPAIVVSLCEIVTKHRSSYVG